MQVIRSALPVGNHVHQTAYLYAYGLKKRARSQKFSQFHLGYFSLDHDRDDLIEQARQVLSTQMKTTSKAYLSSHKTTIEVTPTMLIEKFSSSDIFAEKTNLIG